MEAGAESISYICDTHTHTHTHTLNIDQQNSSLEFGTCDEIVMS